MEYGEVTRIGSSRPLHVDVRIVAATNEHLPEKVEKGTFRADLLDRLSFEVVTLPPLRARRGDIEVLAEFFGRRMASEIGLADWPGWGPNALDALLTYDWPGNVRELRNVVERAVYRWEREGPVDSIEIDPFKSPFRPRTGAPASASAPAAAATGTCGRRRGSDDRRSTAAPISSRGCARSRSIAVACARRAPLQPALDRRGAGADL